MDSFRRPTRIEKATILILLTYFIRFSYVLQFLVVLNVFMETIEIVRVFNAPVEKVWQAWSDSEMFKKWWGPKGFTCPVAHVDFRVGGKYHAAMHGPAGTEFDKDMWSTGIYREIIPMEKIAYVDSFADEKGSVVSASHYGMNGNYPLEMPVAVTFEAVDSKTKMTLRHSGMLDTKETGAAKQGWNESLDKLAEVVS